MDFHCEEFARRTICPISITREGTFDFLKCQCDFPSGMSCLGGREGANPNSVPDNGHCSQFSLDQVVETRNFLGAA
jgi:hypothetical protein